MRRIIRSGGADGMAVRNAAFILRQDRILAQAHRIKPKSPAVRLGVLRFFYRFLRGLGFWSLAAVALGLVAALVTYSPEDPAWTHTATVEQLHNFGGVAGAWFADISLYFFGYAAYLLPLGVAFAGWRLFWRGGLLRLDGELVLLRLIGYLVTLGTTSSLVATHLHIPHGVLPGPSSSGGLVGMHVSQFLLEAFKPLGANAFMAALLLTGLILATGLSWMAVLDGVGAAILRLADWLGQWITAPFTQGGTHTPSEEETPNIPEKPGKPDQSDQPERSGKLKKKPKTRIEPSSTSAMSPQLTAPTEQRLPAAPPSPATESSTTPTTPLALAGAVSNWRARIRAVRAHWIARRHATEAKLDPKAEETTTQTATTTAPPPPPATRQSGRAGAASVSPPLGGRIEPVLNLPQVPPPTARSSMATPPVARSPDSKVMPLTGWAAPNPPDAATDLTLLPSAAWSPPRPLAPTPHAPIPTKSETNTAAVDLPATSDLAPAPAPRSVSEARIPPAIAQPTNPAAPMLARPPAVTPTVPTGSRPLDALPPLALLDPPHAKSSGYSPELLEQMSRQVEVLLQHFGISVNVVAVEPGPVITRFEIEPAPGVKVSQISNLAKDLARGLSVISVRVVEIIPGKSVIGLEIPNQQREIVYLREVLETPVYSQAASALTLALGKDIGGNPVVANLAKMPHLLVAGTTGSGKSVAINAMLLSLLYKARPSEVRLILVDPKMLELSMYEDIPHLLTPVVTDMKEAANALRWCVAEMERRYRLMAACKVRNIAGFNRRLVDAQAMGEAVLDPFWAPEQGDGLERAPALTPLPFIVVVIDELADMMMIVGKKVEELIARLAQKARAAGIHLILATQRPSVDVITGLIKANIPTRIAFQVSSRVDSRTILDQMGAEQLLGHGDMLYLPPGVGLPQRVHGAFVDDHEVPRVVEFLRRTGAPDYVDEVLVGTREDAENPEETDGNGRGGENDPLYDEAVRIVTESRRASVSGVQRRLRIGYNRAARLVEEMEAAGVVGPLQSNGSREVIAPAPP